MPAPTVGGIPQANLMSALPNSARMAAQRRAFMGQRFSTGPMATAQTQQQGGRSYAPIGGQGPTLNLPSAPTGPAAESAERAFWQYGNPTGQNQHKYIGYMNPFFSF